MSKTNIYTALCVELGPAGIKGTTWIDTVHADPGTSLATIRARAIEACADEWGMNPASGDIHCIGLARGEIDFVLWHDPADEVQTMNGPKTLDDAP